MESGVLRGLESTPKEVLQNFLGGQLPLGGQTPRDPRQIQPWDLGSFEGLPSSTLRDWAFSTSQLLSLEKMIASA